MPIIRITKEFRFEGAHALLDYDGKCRHIHGHSYRLFVTFKGEPRPELNHPKSGMVMDFTEIKKIVNKLIIDPFDHSLLLRKDSKLLSDINEAYENVLAVDFQPTCENLTIYFASLLNNNLPANVKLHSIKLYETPTSYVEWVAEDNK